MGGGSSQKTSKAAPASRPELAITRQEVSLAKMDELQKAFELHRRGDLEGAEARYRRVLSGERDHRVALRLLA